MLWNSVNRRGSLNNFLCSYSARGAKSEQIGFAKCDLVDNDACYIFRLILGNLQHIAICELNHVLNTTMILYIINVPSW